MGRKLLILVTVTLAVVLSPTADAVPAAPPTCETLPALNLPKDFGLDTCVGTHATELFDALLDPETKCTLSQIYSLMSLPSVQRGIALARQVAAAPEKISAILYEQMRAASSADVEGFCGDWSATIAPCLETLVPVVLAVSRDDLTCCGQLSDLVDMLQLVVPPTVRPSAFILEDVVNGINSFMCARRTDPGGRPSQTCGASIFQQLTTTYTAAEFRVLESFLLPFVTASAGQECAAFEGRGFTSTASLQPAKAIDYGCCVDHLRPLLGSVRAGFAYVTGTDPIDFLNGVVEFSRPTATFVDALSSAKCAYRSTCTAPSGLIKVTNRVITPGTNNPQKNALKDTVCTKTKRCDARNEVCSEVCQRGSVVLPPWVTKSLQYQRRLAYDGPMCYAQLPATHNSAITLAEGFGNRDQLMNANLDPRKPYSYMRTNNNVLSLTDQLLLGMRWLEVDVHYFLDDLHTAHCGNLGSHSIQVLAEVFKEQLSKFGEVLWSAELLGCFPSLSGIRAEEQPTTRASMQEIRAWLDRPENQRELVVLYLDQGSEILRLGKDAALDALLTDVFGGLLVPRAALEGIAAGGWTGSNATLQRFIDEGQRVVILANIPTAVALGIGDFCKGHAILQTTFINELPDAGRMLGGRRIYGGEYFLRAYQSVLRYISLDDGGRLSRAFPITLDAGNAYNFVRWNLNLVATDAVDGSMMRPQIWSWAENEPLVDVGNATTVFISPDGRWRARPQGNSNVQRKACWEAAALRWTIVGTEVPCPGGAMFHGPRDPYQNHLLQQALIASNIHEPVAIRV